VEPGQDTRRLSSDPAILDSLVELSFSVQDLVARVAARNDASVTQVRLFGTLRDREPTMSDLKTHLSLEKSSVSGLIDRAERRGLVERTTGHPDGRAVHVRLTELGNELANRFAEEAYAELEKLLASLSDRDKRRLSQLARAILATQTSPLTSH
jgi:MarR family transcriptional regulator, lower aerobic nicotinate degradation pathway regulator